MSTYTESILFIWQIAAIEAIWKKHEFIEKEHIFIALCKVHEFLDEEIKRELKLKLDIDVIKEEIKPIISAFSICRINPKYLRRRIRELLGEGNFEKKEREIIHRSPECKTYFKMAEEIAERENSPFLYPVHLFKAILLEPGEIINQALRDLGSNPETLLNALEEKEPVAVGIKEENFKEEPVKPKKTPILDRYGRDLIELAKKKKLFPLIGRKKELLEIIRVLLRTKKNNPVLIGEAGVGKTAIVEGLAQRIAEGNIYPELRNKRIIELDLNALISGTRYRGEFEERLEGILKELKDNPDIILFIDEIHNIVGAGAAQGALDAGNILKPALARGEIRCIGATTITEYRRYIEKDSALERRFQPIFVEEPSLEETREILFGVKEEFEKIHNVKIKPSAIETIVKLCARYLTEKKFPDKAITVLEDACVQKRVDTVSFHGEIKNRQVIIDERDVAQVVAQRSGIPLEMIICNEKEKFLQLEEILNKKIIGQKRAIFIISQALKKAAAGLSDPKRPLGVFLFIGPTGVGKTATAKALAEYLFGSEESIIRFDMSEYMEKHSVAKLIGAPPGYIGYEEEGQLTKQLRTRPYSVVLFDEIEKAHPEILNLFLQLFDEGRITDNKGRIVNAKNAIFIMTSNIGSELYAKNPIGFQNFDTPDSIDLWREIIREIKKIFSPEMINRIDIVPFRVLKEDDLTKIAKNMIEEFEKERLSEKGINLKIENDALNFICKKNYDPAFGARHLKRAIEELIVLPLSEMILKGKIAYGSKVKIILENGNIKFLEEKEFKIDDTTD